MLPWLYDDRYRRRSPDYDRRHPAADPLLLDGMPLRLPDRRHLRLHTSDLTPETSPSVTAGLWWVRELACRRELFQRRCRPVDGGGYCEQRNDLSLLDFTVSQGSYG